MNWRTHNWNTIGMLIGAVAIMISGLHTWSEAFTPQFVGGSLLALSAVLKGMYQTGPNQPPPPNVQPGPNNP